jgi:serine/threonine-protein kinase RsbW
VSDVNGDASALVHPRGAQEVDVRVSADAGQVSLLRAFAASIAIRQDFDVDAIEDLRMAVDEACSMLVRTVRPHGSLLCTFRPAADRVTVRAEVDAVTPTPPSADTLSWHILTSLTDSVAETVEPAGSGHRVSIELVARPTAPQR